MWSLLSVLHSKTRWDFGRFQLCWKHRQFRMVLGHASPGLLLPGRWAGKSFVFFLFDNLLRSVFLSDWVLFIFSHEKYWTGPSSKAFRMYFTAKFYSSFNGAAAWRGWSLYRWATRKRVGGPWDAVWVMICREKNPTVESANFLLVLLGLRYIVLLTHSQLRQQKLGGLWANRESRTVPGTTSKKWWTGSESNAMP